MSVWNEPVKGGRIDYVKTCCVEDVCTCLCGCDICPRCKMEIKRVGKDMYALKVLCPRCGEVLRNDQ